MRNTEEFFQYCLEEFPKLLDCPYLAWDEWDPGIKLSGFKATSAYKSDLDEVFPEIVATVTTHPLVKELELLTNPRRLFSVYSTSDYICDRDFRELAIYREAYRHVDAKYQLYTDIYFTPEHHAGISINSTRKFSEQERAMAEIVCRHLEVAYARLLNPVRCSPNVE